MVVVDYTIMHINANLIRLDNNATLGLEVQCKIYARRQLLVVVDYPIMDVKANLMRLDKNAFRAYMPHARCDANEVG